MDSSIIQCIKIREDFFEKHYSVPSNVQADVDCFIRKMYTIGEQSKDTQDFEAKFAAGGLQDTFTALLMRCTPLPYQMTKEERAAAKETAKEIFREDRSRILKEAAEEAVDHMALMAEEELIAEGRKVMIEADVHDDYTRVTNAIDMAKDPGGFFKSLFRKKK